MEILPNMDLRTPEKVKSGAKSSAKKSRDCAEKCDFLFAWVQDGHLKLQQRTAVNRVSSDINCSKAAFLEDHSSKR